MSHESRGKTDEWYTPKYIFDALGDPFFELDVSSPKDKKKTHVRCAYHITEDSLNTVWHGFIWMNPPFGGRNGIVPWMEKFIEHNDGIALTPDRTSAPWWQNFAEGSDAVLFIKGKVKFIDENGKIGKHPANGTTLFACGKRAIDALRIAESKGLGKLYLNLNLIPKI